MENEFWRRARLACRVVLVWAAAMQIGYGQDGGIQTRPLPLDQTVEQQVVGGGENGYVYSVRLTAGDVLRVELQDKNLDSAMALTRAVNTSQPEIFGRVNAVSGAGREVLLFVARETGNYWLAVFPKVLKPAASFQITSRISADVPGEWDSPLLPVGKAVEKKIKVGESQIFDVILQTGQTLEIEIKCQSVGCQMGLFDEAGKVLTAVEQPSGAAAKTLVFAAQKTEKCSIVIAAVGTAPNGGYRLNARLTEEKKPAFDVRPLPVNEIIERTINGDEIHFYTIKIKKGELIEIETNEKGIKHEVGLSLIAGEPVKLGGNKTVGARHTATYLAERDDEYVFVVSTKDKAKTGTGGYTLKAKILSNQ